MLNGFEQTPRCPGSEAAETMLAKALAETKRGEWSFAAVVLIADDGTSYTDFKGLIKLMPVANLAVDHIKDQIIGEFVRQNAPKVRPANFMLPAGQG